MVEATLKEAEVIRWRTGQWRTMILRLKPATLFENVGVVVHKCWPKMTSSVLPNGKLSSEFLRLLWKFLQRIRKKFRKTNVYWKGCNETLKYTDKPENIHRYEVNLTRLL